MIRVWYMVDNVEYSEELGMSEIDLNSPMWETVVKIASPTECYSSKAEIESFLSFLRDLK